MVLDARNLVAISGGVRERPVDALATVQDPFIVTGVRLPAREGWRSDFVKLAWRRASGKTIVNVSAALRLMNGLFAEARVAVGGYARGRLRESARALAGSRIDTKRDRRSGGRRCSGRDDLVCGCSGERDLWASMRRTRNRAAPHRTTVRNGSVGLRDH